MRQALARPLMNGMLSGLEKGSFVFHNARTRHFEVEVNR